MTGIRPAAIAYVSGPTKKSVDEQCRVATGHAAPEGFALEHIVQDRPDTVTISQLVASVRACGARAVFIPDGARMAQAQAQVRVTRDLEAHSAACVEIGKSRTAASQRVGWLANSFPSPAPGGAGVSITQLPGRDMTTTYDTRQQPERHLVALDIDGTIAVPGTTEISDAVRDSVADAHDAGHDIVLASGRSLVGMLPIADTLGLTKGWAIASNGAATARLDPQAPDRYRLHDVQTFDPEPVARRARSAFPGVRVATEVIGRGYRVTHLFTPHELNGEQQLVHLKKIIERPTTRLILSAPGIADLSDELAACGVTVNPDNDNWLDITPPGLSKATALENVRIQLGIDPHRTTAIGDGLNDLEMLAWAHHGVAMGHAPTQVQDAADRVTGTLEEDGAATVLRALLPETIPTGP